MPPVHRMQELIFLEFLILLMVLHLLLQGQVDTLSQVVSLLLQVELKLVFFFNPFPFSLLKPLLSQILLVLRRFHRFLHVHLLPVVEILIVHFEKVLEIVLILYLSIFLVLAIVHVILGELLLLRHLVLPELIFELPVNLLLVLVVHLLLQTHVPFLFQGHLSVLNYLVFEVVIQLSLLLIHLVFILSILVVRVLQLLL